MLITNLNFRTPLEEDDTEDFLDVEAYLVKPVASDTLIEKIESILKLRS